MNCDYKNCLCCTKHEFIILPLPENTLVHENLYNMLIQLLIYILKIL